MLVLTRKIGEAILIGSDILVEVVEIRGGRVRLGITAPDSVAIARAGVTEKEKSSHPQIPSIPLPVPRRNGISKSSDAFLPAIP